MSNPEHIAPILARVIDQAVAAATPDRACASCHFFNPAHQSCGNADSPHRGEFVHPMGRCANYLRGESDE